MRSDMGWKNSGLRVGVALAAALLAFEVVAAEASTAPPAEEPAPTAVVGVRLFNGRDVIPEATVVFAGDRITAAGAQLAAPAGARVIDGRGRTLLPGLIDSHVHAFGDALARGPVFGVTTMLDMFTSPEFAAQTRREQAEGKAEGRADLFSAGILATAPGGHGTQFGIEIPTLTGPEQAAGWVADRVAQGSDYIKIILEDGSSLGGSIPTLDEPTLKAVVAAAHQQGKLAVVHVTTFDKGRQALAAGADGLVHLFRDREADAAWVTAAAEAGLFVVPTLTVLEGTMGTPSGAALVDDPRFSPLLRRDEARNLKQAFPRRNELDLGPVYATVRALKAAGVPLLAGTDAPNPGTWYGVSMHRELEMLVAAGLTPVEALRAATSAPAEAFGLADRGVIAPGMRADLLLVEGDPTAEIEASRAIVTVWKEGQEIPRQEASAEAAAGPGAPRIEPGPVADFDSGEISARYGFGWSPSDDGMMGGKSTVELAVVEGGAGESAGALRVAGEIRAGFPFPWAGAMFFPGSQRMRPVDLSAARELVFQARAEAEGTFRLMVFAASLGRVPAELPFTAGPAWRQVVIPLAEFPGVEPEGLMAVLFSGGPQPGPFAFVIDEVAFR